MKRRWVYLVSFVLALMLLAGCSNLGLPLPEEKGSLTVTVVDSETSDVIENAKVQIEGESGYQNTDSQGKCTFTSLNPATYSLTISKDGYVTATVTAVVASGQNSQTVELDAEATGDTSMEQAKGMVSSFNTALYGVGSAYVDQKVVVQNVNDDLREYFGEMSPYLGESVNGFATYMNVISHEPGSYEVKYDPEFEDFYLEQIEAGDIDADVWQWTLTDNVMGGQTVTITATNIEKRAIIEDTETSYSVEVDLTNCSFNYSAESTLSDLTYSANITIPGENVNTYTYVEEYEGYTESLILHVPSGPTMTASATVDPGVPALGVITFDSTMDFTLDEMTLAYNFNAEVSLETPVFDFEGYLEFDRPEGDDLMMTELWPMPKTIYADGAFTTPGYELTGSFEMQFAGLQYEYYDQYIDETYTYTDPIPEYVNVFGQYSSSTTTFMGEITFTADMANYDPDYDYAPLEVIVDGSLVQDNQNFSIKVVAGAENPSVGAIYNEITIKFGMYTLEGTMEIGEAEVRFDFVDQNGINLILELGEQTQFEDGYPIGLIQNTEETELATIQFRVISGVPYIEVLYGDNTSKLFPLYLEAYLPNT